MATGQEIEIAQGANFKIEVQELNIFDIIGFTLLFAILHINLI